MTRIDYSIDTYDKDGYTTEAGIYIHFNQTRIKVADNMDEFLQFIKDIKTTFRYILEEFNSSALE